MLLKVSIKIGELKGFLREYIVRDTDTLYTLSRKMGFDMDFPQDQLVLFKAVKEDFTTAVNRYSTVNLGAGTIDRLTFGDMVEKKEMNFVYFYDTTNKKSVKLIIEGELDELEMPRHESVASILTPFLLSTKGPNPIDFENGYVAFEDQPKKERRIDPLSALLGRNVDDDDEDDDEDLDDEEDEDLIAEEAEEIYDGDDE